MNDLQQATIPNFDGSMPLQGLLCHDWRVKIADFTLSKHASAKASELQSLTSQIEQDAASQGGVGSLSGKEEELNW